MRRLVLLRHGESQWNKENRFTGWTDVDLTPKGIHEAEQAGNALTKAGYTFDIAYTSVLKRAIRTLWITLDVMDSMWIPVVRHWRLNERHYGALQGLNKSETARKFSEEQVQIWRRSFDTPPPSLDCNDSRWPGLDRRYQQLAAHQLPVAESLKNTIERFLPYWHDTIAPSIQKGDNVLIVAHGNSLRALVKHLESIADEKIAELNIPTGIPLVYELDDLLRPTNNFYLGTPKEVSEALEAVVHQGKAKE